MRYRYYVANNKVICISSFAGKPVRGIAKCDTNSDTFNEETGKKLAMLRCDEKVAIKRADRASYRYEEACRLQKEVDAYVTKMLNYYNDARKDLVKAKEELANFEESLK